MQDFSGLCLNTIFNRSSGLFLCSFWYLRKIFSFSHLTWCWQVAHKWLLSDQGSSNFLQWFFKIMNEYYMLWKAFSTSVEIITNFVFVYMIYLLINILNHFCIPGAYLVMIYDLLDNFCILFANKILRILHHFSLKRLSCSSLFGRIFVC